jgi:hypothetical protein
MSQEFVVRATYIKLPAQSSKAMLIGVSSIIAAIEAFAFFEAFKPPGAVLGTSQLYTYFSSASVYALVRTAGRLVDAARKFKYFCDMLKCQGVKLK